MPQLTAALGASTRQLVLVVDEEAQRMTAGQAEGDPISQCLPPLFLDPVALQLGHAGPL